MTRTLLAGGMMLLAVGLAQAQSVDAPHSQSVVSPQYKSAGGAQYGVDITSVTTLTLPNGTIIAEICVPTIGANYTTSGTTPTAVAGTGGIPVAAGGCFQLSGSTVLAAFKIIGAAGALMSVEYFK